MNHRMKPMIAAAALSTLIATSAMALHWTGDARRAEAIQELIFSLQAAREADPVLREAPYGETQEGSAWDHYALAIECVSGIEDHRDRCMALVEAKTNEERAEAKELLKEAGPLFDHLKRGAHARNATRPIDWDAHLAARIVKLTHCRAMGQLVQAHAYQLIVAGRSVEAAHAMLDMQQFAVDLMMSPSLIEEMIGCAVVAPRQFRCEPAPGSPAMSEEGKRTWLDGVRKLKASLPTQGRSFDGELELLARYLQDDQGRTEEQWDDESPGWRYGFSWETAAAEYALELSEKAPAYRAALGSPDGLAALEQLENEYGSSPNPAAARLSCKYRSAAISRREALMRLGLVEHGLALEIGVSSTPPTHPLGHPVTAEVAEPSVRVGTQAPGGHYRFLFELLH